jgi:hypothetical protein
MEKEYTLSYYLPLRFQVQPILAASCLSMCLDLGCYAGRALDSLKKLQAPFLCGCRIGSIHALRAHHVLPD